jgi:hypothetical protein
MTYSSKSCEDRLSVTKGVNTIFFVTLDIVKLFIRLILLCNSIISDYKEDHNLQKVLYLIEIYEQWSVK